MNMLQTITPTISSREISELVESRHDNVKRSMETLRDGGLISFTQSQETSHDGPGARPDAACGVRVSFCAIGCKMAMSRIG